IRASDAIGSITVGGSLVGNSGPLGDSPVIISARGQGVQGAGADVAIGSLTVGDRLEYAQIFARYNTDLVPVNADAPGRTVTVGGDWAASDLVAGSVNLGADDQPGGTGDNADNVSFGDLHDHKITGGTDSPSIVSQVGSITITGQVFGTPLSLGAGERYGFVA